MSNFQQQKQKAAQAQVKALGQPILHTLPDGNQEWLWGQFEQPPESGLSASGFDFEGAVPVVKLMFGDAVNVSATPRRSHFDTNEPSKFLVEDQEYQVAHVHNYANGKVHVQLSKACKPANRVAVAPACLRQLGSMAIDNDEPC